MLIIPSQLQSQNFRRIYRISQNIAVDSVIYKLMRTNIIYAQKGVFATNSNFLITLSLQLDISNLDCLIKQSLCIKTKIWGSKDIDILVCVKSTL